MDILEQLKAKRKKYHEHEFALDVAQTILKNIRLCEIRMEDYAHRPHRLEILKKCHARLVQRWNNQLIKSML